VVRDSRGNIGAFLNTCRHRGMRVCRADQGNAAAFTCTYHGWTYGNDGKLVGVPGYKEYYYEELNMEEWGLVPVAQVDSYKGMIFGTFDPTAPSLIEYLGDYAFYMDMYLDRPGGTEIIGGVHKWVMPCNWKLPAENFLGDSYHFTTTHISAIKTQNRDQSSRGIGFSASPGYGHGMMITTVDPASRASQDTTVLQQYAIDIKDDIESMQGPVRANVSRGAGTLFPNLSFHTSPSIRIWHPRGPDKIEIWSWCMVDKGASPEIKEEMRVNYLRSFSMAGTLEQDDGENWEQVTLSSKGVISKRYPFNYNLGKGHEPAHEEFPGQLGRRVSEHNQRLFYKRWSDLMSSESWPR
jgi:phenylpropionate dioxygenase-like ring-hydroxylating dioxygenase large terminal subunit